MISPASRDWDAEISALRDAVGYDHTPVVSRISREKRQPYRVLVSTIISLRTKDEVTGPASRRLLDAAPNPEILASMDEATIARAIFPAGFYRVKAGQLRRIGRILLEEYGGHVPSNLNELQALPGVGLKTANLVLGEGFGIPAICVDIHVHRIANRRGWIETRHPDASEAALREILLRRYWIEINRLLVRFGQTVCTPRSPRCGSCPLGSGCPQIGVTRRR